MFNRYLKALGVITLLMTFVIGNVFASDFAELAVNQFKLKSLSNHVQPSQGDSLDKVSIAMVYQPECKWCKKQGKWLAKALEQCSESIDIILIGNNGKKQQLKRELKHFHDEIPAYLANRKLLTAIGGVEASPTTLVFNQLGKLIAKKRGFVSDSKLSDVAKIISQGSCQIH